jgi:glutamate/tyrosine decarboxylase-like PLP-dependent enzyme
MDVESGVGGRLMLPAEERAALWRALFEAVEGYQTRVGAGRVAPRFDPEAIRARLAPFDFEQPVDPVALVRFVADQLEQHQTHPSHPRYFGLFNPAPTTMGIAADALVAAFNPQLSTWNHSPFAVEVERHMLRELAARFGYPADQADGTFATGGSEANHTAVLTALEQAFPDVARRGLRALEGQPTLYASSECHRSLVKAARLCGLGSEAVREVPVDGRFAIDVAELERRIASDRAEGRAPFMVVATAGTTSAGVIEPLGAVADVAARERLWLHVDAAWGGAAALVPRLRPYLAGIERADSITFDAHKWLSVPMGAGVYLTRHRGILRRTFEVEAAYVPRYTAGLDVVDPYASSIQWSRRFIGLKVFLSIAVAGWDGYAEALGQQALIGDRLRERLTGDGWRIVNQTPLPVVCFVDATHRAGREAAYLEAIGRDVVVGGRAWVSTTLLGGTTPVLRACVTNVRTRPEDVDLLVETLDFSRHRIGVAWPTADPPAPAAPRSEESQAAD